MIQAFEGENERNPCSYYMYGRLDVGVFLQPAVFRFRSRPCCAVRCDRCRYGECPLFPLFEQLSGFSIQTLHAAGLLLIIIDLISVSGLLRPL